MPCAGSINAYQVEGVDVWYACTKAAALKPLLGALSSDEIKDLSDVLSIPQADSMTVLRRLTAAPRVKTTGTCGALVKVGTDIREIGWRFAFLEQCGVPTEHGYLLHGDCFYFGWRTCACNNGGVAQGTVSFGDDYLLDASSSEAVVRDAFTVDLCSSKQYTLTSKNVIVFDDNKYTASTCWPRQGVTPCPEVKTCCPTDPGPSCCDGLEGAEGRVLPSVVSDIVSASQMGLDESPDPVAQAALETEAAESALATATAAAEEARMKASQAIIDDAERKKQEAEDAAKEASDAEAEATKAKQEIARSGALKSKDDAKDEAVKTPVKSKPVNEKKAE